MKTIMTATRIPAYLIGLLLASTLLISSCASTPAIPDGVVFVSHGDKMVFGRRDIFNVTSVQEAGGTFLITLWLSDPGIQRLSTMLAKTDDKRIDLFIGGRQILKNKPVENVSHLARIQMRAADATVANALVADIKRAQQRVPQVQ